VHPPVFWLLVACLLASLAGWREFCRDVAAVQQLKDGVLVGGAVCTGDNRRRQSEPRVVSRWAERARHVSVATSLPRERDAACHCPISSVYTPTHPRGLRCGRQQSQTRNLHSKRVQSTKHSNSRSLPTAATAAALKHPSDDKTSSSAPGPHLVLCPHAGRHHHTGMQQGPAPLAVPCWPLSAHPACASAG
jgi:hypothetical protein